MVSEQLDILLTSCAEAVEKIVDVGCGELRRVLEASHVVIDVVVLLNGLDDVALAFEFEKLLSNHNMGVIDWYCDVAEIAFVLVKTSWVAVGTLVVRNRPLRCGHDAQVVIPLWIHRAYKRVLGECRSLNCHQSY